MKTTEPIFGAAIGDISPTAALALAGRGGPLRIAVPRSASLAVNAVVIADAKSTVAIVGVDTLFCSSTLHEKVQQQLASLTKTKFDALFLVASHTHQAPSLDPSKPYLGPVDDQYFLQAVKTISNTVLTAFASAVRGVTVKSGQSTCDANARRRKKAIRILKRPPFFERKTFTLPVHASDVPRAFTIFVAHDALGRPLWAIWSWACHATAYPNLHEVHADFPGEIREHIRKILSHKELPVIYLPGLAGDLRADASPTPVPFLKKLMTPFARPFADGSEENFAILCDKLKLSCAAALSSQQPIESNNFNIVSRTTSVPLKQLMPATHHQGVIEMSWLSMGALSFYFAGAEMCSPWRSVLAKEFPPDTIFTGYCNDVPCYLPTDKQVLEGGYEVTGFQTSFAVDGQFKAGVEQDVVSALQKLKD